MADTKLTALTEDTAPTIDDLLYLVNDPGGTPGEKKLKLENLLKFIAGLTADATPTNDDLVATINDPSGTPAARKVTIGDLLHLTSASVLSTSDLVLTGAYQDVPGCSIHPLPGFLLLPVYSDSVWECRSGSICRKTPSWSAVGGHPKGDIPGRCTS